MRYSAFISYNHRDQQHARWLHNAIESYRIPKYLHGRDGALGPIGARVGKVFRDRDELAASADLADVVQAALADSETLIVICSPGGAQSKWVNAEIREFTRLGRRDRILCLIVGGEPNAADPAQESLPPALFDDGGHEPLAADIRAGQDSKADARLKLIASILGVGFDELRQREQARRVRQLTAIAAGATTGLVITAALAVTAYLARNEAVRQRDIARERSITAERTVEFVKGMFTVADPSESPGLTVTAREIVDRGVRDYAVALRNEPVVKAEIGLTLSEVYGALGLYQQSDHLVKATQSLPASAHTVRARQAMLLGESQFRLSSYDAALASFTRAVGMARTDPNARETILARALAGLGQTYSAQDRFDDATRALNEAIAIDTARGPAGSRDLARDLEALALNDYYAGDIATAKPLLERANSLRLAKEGANSPSVSDNFGTLAAIAYGEGRSAEAERNFAARLKIDEVVLGRNHPSVATTRNNLGRLMLERGAYDAASAMLEPAVASAQSEMGAQHDDMAFMLSNLALVRLGQGRLGDAGRLLRDALPVARAHKHRTLGPILTDLASVRCRQGDVASATGLLPEARTMTARDYPDDPWRMAWLESVTAECEWRTGARAAAQQRMAKVLPALKKKWSAQGYFASETARRQAVLGLK